MVYSWPLCYVSVRRRWRYLRAIFGHPRLRVVSWSELTALATLFSIEVSPIYLQSIGVSMSVFGSSMIYKSADFVLSALIAILLFWVYAAPKDRAQDTDRALWVYESNRAENIYRGWFSAHQSTPWHTREEALNAELQLIARGAPTRNASYFVESVLGQACNHCDYKLARWAVDHGARARDHPVHGPSLILECAIYNDTCNADLTRLLVFECGVKIQPNMVYRTVSVAVNQLLVAAASNDPRDPYAAFDTETFGRQTWHNPNVPRPDIQRALEKYSPLRIMHTASQALINKQLRRPPAFFPRDGGMQRCNADGDGAWMGSLPEELLLNIARRVVSSSDPASAAAQAVRLAATCRQWRRVAADCDVAVEVASKHMDKCRSLSSEERAQWMRRYMLYPSTWLYVLGSARCFAIDRAQRTRATMDWLRMPN